MPWNVTDELTLDDQLLKMIGPIPPSVFVHRKLEIRKLCVEGYNGYKKKITDEYNVEFKPEYQIGNGRFGKVFKGTSLDSSTVFAFKGTIHSLKLKQALDQHVRLRDNDPCQRYQRGNAQNG